MIVTVVGAGGHVGLPFSLVVANAGHKVYGLDRNDKLVGDLNTGEVPYIEHGADALLKEMRDKDRILFTCNPYYVRDSDVVAIMLGTPVDEENNPRLDDLFEFVDNILIPNLQLNQLIILRSTVAPGTTEVIRDRIESKTKYKEGDEFFLVYCPERVLQTKGIEETTKLPQLIGSFNENSYLRAAKFFNFAPVILERLTPREAEVAKLMCNMWRRLNGAYANEMYMLADTYNVNINKVIDAANYNYERMGMILPGFMSGPCLYKDGEFLVGNTPYNELIKTSFEINEGFVNYIFRKAKKLIPEAKTFGILGTGFKSNCDDERQSLSHKMKKVAKFEGMDVKLHDPYHSYSSLTDVLNCDIVVLMTPHKEYSNTTLVDTTSKLFVDVWKLSPMSKDTIDGFVIL